MQNLLRLVPLEQSACLSLNPTHFSQPTVDLKVPPAWVQKISTLRKLQDFVLTGKVYIKPTKPSEISMNILLKRMTHMYNTVLWQPKVGWMPYLELWGHGEKSHVFYMAPKTLAVPDNYILNAYLLIRIVESWLYCWITIKGSPWV